MSQLPEELKGNFTLVTKRIIKENLTSNIEKHKEYIRDLVPTFNAIISFYNFKISSGVTEELLIQIKAELKKYKAKFAECLRRLKIEAELGTNLLKIYNAEDFIKIIDSLNEINTSVLNASQLNESDSEEEIASNFAKQNTNTTKSNTNTEIPKVRVNQI